MFHHLMAQRCRICRLTSKTGLICQNCWQLIPRREQACISCHRATTEVSRQCGHCLNSPPAWERLIAPFQYTGIVQHMIGRYKYHHAHHWGRWLSMQLADHLLAQRPGAWPQALIPVPIHTSRLRRRGFNQAHGIASEVSARLGIPVLHTLCQRSMATPPQNSINAQQRQYNLMRAFEVQGECPDHIALIDDVSTTGSTLSSLARTLQKHGAKRIEAWCLAVTVKHPR